MSLSTSSSSIKKNEYIPFVEKYRATDFNNIILDPINKKILTNIINTMYFPNLLFYGPPGTGKTTTIINLINSYQKNTGKTNKELIIHLNASDERGIEIIRSQINQFVNADSLFEKGLKFVILDEVDSMTKNAQQALRYLLQSYSTTVRFCLICNYISRIDEGLQNELLRLKFNQLPEENICTFLYNISELETLGLSMDNIRQIQKLYISDIRSMINFMQSMQNMDNKKLCILDNEIWEMFYTKIKNQETIDVLQKLNNTICIKYNIDKKNMIKNLLNYIIRNKPHEISSEFIDFTETLMHSDCSSLNNYISYAFSKLSELLVQSHP